MTDQAGDTAVARLTADRTTAERAASAIAESFDPDEVVTVLSENAPDVWTVSFYFRQPPDVPSLQTLAARAGATAETLVFETVAATDWVNASLAGLSPVDAGRFVIHGAHDRAQVPANRIGIEIEAALAFGTAHHGTTRGCLLALNHLLKSRRPRRILDLGTGTGVLAIAAARSLRCSVLASDIDHRAIDAARRNARHNRVGALVRVVHGNGLRHRCIRRHRPYDLIFANILLAPLVALSHPIGAAAAGDACVILSGLLTAQASAALAAYRRQGFMLERRLSLDGWTTLVLRRAGRRCASRANAHSAADVRGDFPDLR